MEPEYWIKTSGDLDSVKLMITDDTIQVLTNGKLSCGVPTNRANLYLVNQITNSPHWILTNKEEWNKH